MSAAQLTVVQFRILRWMREGRSLHVIIEQGLILQAWLDGGRVVDPRTARVLIDVGRLTSPRIVRRRKWGGVRRDEITYGARALSRPWQLANARRDMQLITGKKGV